MRNETPVDLTDKNVTYRTARGYRSGVVVKSNHHTVHVTISNLGASRIIKRHRRKHNVQAAS